MRAGWLFLVLFVLCLPGLAAAAAPNELSLVLTYPEDGQILYAGPGVPRYAVPVSGRVVASQGDVATVEVRLDVMQGTRRLAGAQVRPQPTGDFEVMLTVNPDAAIMVIPPELSYCRECHDAPALATLGTGDNTLVVTASRPGGGQTVVHRRLFVDRSGLVGLTAVLEGAGPLRADLEDVRVVAATEFPVTASPSTNVQTREFSGVTDAAGRAQLRVETMSSFPLRYRVYVPPVVRRGLLISSLEDVLVTVPAKAEQVPPVVVPITARGGQVVGLVQREPGAGPATVCAVSQPVGLLHRATAEDTADTFRFADLPMGRYLVAAVDDQGGSLIVSEVQAVNLEVVPEAQVTLRIQGVPESRVSGQVRSADGWPLPFAWVTDQATGARARVNPADGRFVLAVQGGGTRTLNVVAPGHWSEARVAQSAASSEEHVTLAWRPDSRRMAVAGDGWLAVPSESTVAERDGIVVLYNGWLWGQTGSAAYTLATPSAQMTIEAGSAFAVEHPARGTAWLYMRSGQATVALDGWSQAIAVGGGQMLALSHAGVAAPQAVAMSEPALAVLHAGEASGLVFRNKPGLMANVQTTLARLGISVAQVVTLVTYVLAVAAVVVGVGLVLVWQAHSRRAD